MIPLSRLESQAMNNLDDAGRIHDSRNSARPLLFRDSGAMVMAIIAVFFLCNFLMMLIQMFCIPVFVKCLLVPRYLLYPVVLVMCIVGCYASTVAC